MKEHRREWMRRREAERYRMMTPEQREKHNQRIRLKRQEMRAAYLAVKDILPDIDKDSCNAPNKGARHYRKMRAAYLAVKNMLGEQP